MTKVLLIEDNVHIRAGIAETLDFEGFTTIEAENGLVGVEMAHQHLPDLIICDIMMPELDGYSVLLQLRESPATAMIPFIFLTAHTEKSAWRHGMELGADDYLTKPFMPDELIAAVKSRLERHHVLVKDSERRIDELRNNLLLTLPHELRTPLTSVIGYSDLILMNGEKMDHQKIVKLVTSINRSGRRLLRMIENYLLYAQIELIQNDTERVREFLRYVVEQPGEIVAKIINQKANEAGRENDIVFDIENVPVGISDDSLQKIIVELIDNALKFSVNGTPIEIRSMVDGNDYFLQIKDAGCGMTVEQIRSIGAYMQFERKLHEQQGAGLGLVIAKRLVQLHGGNLEIESIYGQETAVIIKLPLR